MSYLSTSQRRVALAVGVVLTMASAGCGQDPELDSSNRGSGSDTEMTSVENAYIVPRSEPGACAIQVGDAGELRFTVTNNRPAEPERLLGISTEAADAIRISPQAQLEIPPKTSIAAGQPIEHPADPSAPDSPFRVTVEGLDESATPGKSVDVTFRFDKFGDLTMQVPIEACPRQQP